MAEEESPANCGWIGKTCHESDENIWDNMRNIYINKKYARTIGNLGWYSIRILRLTMSAV
jgi:hypothetical protein